MPHQEELVLFSPLNVIGHFQELKKAVERSGNKPRSFRKAEEANFVAEALAGRRSADGQNYWLRLIGNEDRTPDIKTYSWKNSGKIPDEMWEHFVEVTEYEEHSPESIVEFLARTKLWKYKDDPQLIILCRINKEVSLPSLVALKEALLSENAVNPILLCGRVSEVGGSDGLYKLIQIEPDVETVPESKTFNLQDELLSMKYEGVLVLSRNGTPGKYPDVKHYPFETLGFIPESDSTYQV
jgi:hypothetical protein